MSVQKANGVWIFVTICIALSASNLRAQTRVDIVQIWQNFIASRVAAEKCGGVDKATENQFLANLNDVTIRAAQTIQERNSGQSLNEIGNQMRGVGSTIRGKVNDEINLSGCTSPKIQQLLSLYKMHATMRF